MIFDLFMERLRSKLGQYRISRHRDSCRMTHEKLGTNYGGWYVPSELLNSSSVCYSAGAGEDISFDIQLARHFDCNVYIFDPTPRALEHYELFKHNTLSRITNPKENNEFNPDVAALPRLRFIACGLWSKRKVMRFYVPKNPTHVSHSIVNAQKTEDYFEAECRTVMDLMSELNHTEITLLKLDVEGAEYEIVNSLLTNSIYPSILCLEFDEGYNPQDPDYLNRIVGIILRLKQVGYLATFFDSWNVTFVHKQAMDNILERGIR